MSAAEVELRVEQITKKFLDVIRAATQDPEGELIEVVPQEDYRKAFLKSAQDLAPPVTGKTFNQIEIKSSSDDEPRPVILIPETRSVIKEALYKSEPEPQMYETEADAKSEVMTGMGALLLLSPILLIVIPMEWWRLRHRRRLERIYRKSSSSYIGWE